MAPTLADRVKETTTSTGTGDLTLDGAVSGFQNFAAAIGTATQFLYAIVHQDAAEWETGIGQVTTSTNFQRDTVTESSNADAKVSFSAGTKDVFVAPVGTRAALLASGGRIDPAHASGLVLLATATASADATVDFTANIDATYDEYIFALQNVVPATDNVSLYLRTSTDAGANWDSGASDYDYERWQFSDFSASSAGDSEIELTGTVGSAANEVGVTGRIRIYRPSAAEYTRVGWTNEIQDGAGTVNGFIGAGHRLSAADVTGVRFLFSSGNIESGELKLYGVVKS